MNDKNKLNKKYQDPKNTGGLSKRMEEQQKIDQIASPQNEVSGLSKKILATNLSGSNADKKCSNFCRSDGFYILPLRYGVTQINAKSLPKNLGENVVNMSLQHSKYTAEMVDSGYIYQLIVRHSGKKEWWAYKVTPQGYLSLFPIAKQAPITVPEFACKSAGHKFIGSVISVPHNPKDEAKTTFILYSHVDLTQNKIKELEQDPEGFAQKGIWQKIDIAAWKAGSHNQKHCLNNTNLKNTIFNIQSFGDRINQTIKMFNVTPELYAAIALYDPIGITVNLNDYRNEAYAPVDTFLNSKDKNGVTNQRKLDASQRIDNLKGLLAKKNQEFHQKNELDSRQPLDGRLKGKLLTIEEMKVAAQKRGDQKEVERLELRRQDVLREHDALMKTRGNNAEEAIGMDTKADWETCDEHLALDEVDAFKKEADSKYDAALKIANQRAQDHLNWINSNSLYSALDVYDDKDLKNGCAFKAHVATLLFGMEGATDAAKKLDDWIKKPNFERRNLFIRGLYSNQNEAKTHHEQVVKNATDITAVGIKLLKGVVDFLKKMDSAFDEWARVHTEVDKNGNPSKLKGNVLFTGVEKRMMLFVSNFARSIFRAGMGTKAEYAFVKAISQKLLFVQMGELAEKLRFDEVVHSIDPEKNQAIRNNFSPELRQKMAPELTANAKAATLKSLDVLIDDAMLKSKETLKKLKDIEGKDMKNATNNYHQVRASGILILLESINLVNMLESGKYQTKEQIAALTASIAGLFAFGLDVFYGLAKGVREVANQSAYSGAGAAATRGAANIQRGVIKFFAAGFSTIAGSITALLDFNKGVTEKNKVGDTAKTLTILYFSRGLSGSASALLGVFAALTYLGPVVNYVSRIGGNPFIARIGATKLVEKLTIDIIRVVLLRGIAWASGLGLILTIAEVTYLMIVEFTKLRRWCEHCTFRQLKSNKLMSEEQEAADFERLIA